MKLRWRDWVLRIESHRPVLGRCAECHWWDQQYVTPGESRGHCHRLAPLTDHNGRTIWPRTNSKQSCGQFRARVEEKPAAPVEGGAK